MFVCVLLCCGTGGVCVLLCCVVLCFGGVGRCVGVWFGVGPQRDIVSILYHVACFMHTCIAFFFFNVHFRPV